jgi:hypothetical protein
MNYHYVDWVYRKYKLQDKLSDDYFSRTGQKIADECSELGMDCRLVF